MTLTSQRELLATREKLRRLEERYAANQGDSSGPDHAGDLSQRSLKRLINQLKEEIARFESHTAIGTPNRAQ
jgi:hypothetical protein